MVEEGDGNEEVTGIFNIIMLVLTACTSKEKTINDNEEGF